MSSFSLFFFGPRRMACGILVPQPGIEPGPSAVKAWSPNHWTTREFPILDIGNLCSFLVISLTKGLTNFVDLFKKPILGFVIFSIVCF